MVFNKRLFKKNIYLYMFCEISLNRMFIGLFVVIRYCDTVLCVFLGPSLSSSTRSVYSDSSPMILRQTWTFRHPYVTGFRTLASRTCTPWPFNEDRICRNCHQAVNYGAAWRTDCRGKVMCRENHRAMYAKVPKTGRCNYFSLSVGQMWRKTGHAECMKYGVLPI